MVRPIMEPAFPAARSRRPRMAAAAPLVLVGCSAMAVNVIRSSVTRKLMYRSSGRAGLNSCADSRRNHATAVRTVCEATAPGHPAQRGTHVSECAGRHGRLPCLGAHERVACALDICRDPFQELIPAVHGNGIRRGAQEQDEARESMQPSGGMHVRRTRASPLPSARRPW